MSVQLFTNSYGKSDVRLTKVIRNGPVHQLLEYSVDIKLHGSFGDSYTRGDNSQIIATDSMKNTVYVLAKENRFDSPEQFAILLAEHFARTYPQVEMATATVRQLNWQRIAVDGQPHDHAFISAGPEIRTALVSAEREITGRIEGGITDLRVVKTSQSAFKNFVTDRYRTLKDADDRIFGTSITAEWVFPNKQVDFNAAFSRIRSELLNVFATHMSHAVQETMYEMGKAAMAAVPDLQSIRLRMPNKHRIPINLDPFGLKNNNEIFVWTDEPYGDITAYLRRTND